MNFGGASPLACIKRQDRTAPIPFPPVSAELLIYLF